jgi:hypothetical protein
MTGAITQLSNYLSANGKSSLTVELAGLTVLLLICLCSLGSGRGCYRTGDADGLIYSGKSDPTSPSERFSAQIVGAL